MIEVRDLSLKVTCVVQELSQQHRQLQLMQVDFHMLK